MGKIRNFKEIDFWPESQIEKYQLKKVKEQACYAYKNSAFYKRLLDKIKLRPEKIKSFKDFREIPITTKEDVRRSNWDFVSLDRKEWADMFATSGTSGQSVYFPYSRTDMQRLTRVSAQALLAAGLRKHDLVQLTLPMGTAMWQGGLAYFLGCGYNRACVLRIGPGFIPSHVNALKMLKADVIIGTPSFLLNLGSVLEKEKDFFKRPRLILTIGENILGVDLKKNHLGQKLIEVWKTEIRSGYGNTECGMGAFECSFAQGHHYAAQYCYVEVVDQDTGKKLNDGERGELIITPLNVSAAPLLRYAIGDISFKLSSRCGCARNSPRIGSILGRTDEQMKIKGVKVYPCDIRNAVLKVPEISLCFIQAYTDEHLSDNIKISVSSPAGITKEKQTSLISQVRESVKFNLGIKAQVEFKQEAAIQEMMLPAGSRKPRTFNDLRRK